MRTLGLAAALSLALVADAAAQPPATSASPNVQVAYFQARTLFHSGLRDTHTVALTFDDGPNLNTPGVLDVLKAMNVKATFFIVGKMAKAYPQILARVAAEGHLLANHSATHPFLSSRYDTHPEMLIDQLRQVNDEISPLMKPGDQLFFRAPYGAWRSAHAAILNADPVLRNYTGPVYWDIGGETSMRDGYIMSSADWECWHHHWTADTCAKGYLREIRRKNGGIVLMHCIHSQSPALVEAVVPALVEEGYNFVRIDQIQDFRQYETPSSTPAVADAGSQVVRDAELIDSSSVK
jgi:peptidoglycan/xylan/chitin deacetylase (PgdA/CDA1 family)